jgi:hypothetical protein
MKYNSLKDSIPKEWREILKTTRVNRNDITIQDDLLVDFGTYNLPSNILRIKMFTGN